MSIRNRFFAASALMAAALAAQTESRSSVKVNLPADSPVSLLSADWGESRASERGSALVLNLNTSLALRNSSNRRIRAISWMVLSQEATPGGRASVTKASLDVGPNETFPLRVDLKLLRPVQRGSGPMVEMTLDGVLFDDMTFWGPNRLDSRRVMTAFELEAQRDRRYFQQVMQSQGLDGLKRECLASIARQGDLPRMNVSLARAGRATAMDPERQVQLSFLHFPGAPVDAVAGIAHVSGQQARAPKVEVENRSARAVSYLEVGWILKDSQGREFVAGSVPAKAALPPGKKAEVLQDAALRFNEPVSIESMTGFVSQVEFADGQVWIPSRAELRDPRLQRALIPSAEEQRLTNIYRKRGVQALVDELKKF